jgi:anti-sigma regulatory factor (Ser/Thr protein kinase)
MEMFQTELAPLPHSSHAARMWARPKLQAWNCGGVADEVELLLSELVSNVVEHVGAPMSVRLRRLDDTVRVEVDDPSEVAPVVRAPDVGDERGRGMRLIASFADRWGTELHSRDGKTVWFELVGPRAASS